MAKKAGRNTKKEKKPVKTAKNKSEGTKKSVGQPRKARSGKSSLPPTLTTGELAKLPKFIQINLANQ